MLEIQGLLYARMVWPNNCQLIMSLARKGLTLKTGVALYQIFQVTKPMNDQWTVKDSKIDTSGLENIHLPLTCLS